ncbi:unnamed protein product [Zymoseptoria tritici ST99CH_1E4]|uniref:Uncharacterized protein n=1 Tax=Zymoseptoria tritici ST99CH_1E4 TaxID=1276532 RepID=A0A2H1H0N0_ZYMTR|nr:unnamed protein product [Zymoseptoria tritici ST99CH_1E4]
MSRFGGLRLSTTGDNEAIRPAPAAQSSSGASSTSPSADEERLRDVVEDASREMSLDSDEQDEVGEDDSRQMSLDAEEHGEVRGDNFPAAPLESEEEQDDVRKDASPVVPSESDGEDDTGGHARVRGLRLGTTGGSEATRPAPMTPSPIVLSSNSSSSSEVESSDDGGASREAPFGADEDDGTRGHLRVGGLRPLNIGDTEGARLAPPVQSPILLSSNSPSSSDVESTDPGGEASREAGPGSEDEDDHAGHSRNSGLRPSTTGDIEVTRLAPPAQSPIVLSSNSPSSSDVDSSAPSVSAGQQEDDTRGHLRVGGLRPSISGGTEAARPAAHSTIVLSSNSPSSSDVESSAASASAVQELPFGKENGENTGDDAAAVLPPPSSSSDASPEGEVNDSTFELVGGVYRELLAGSSIRQTTSEREDEETTSNTAVAEQPPSLARVKGKGPAFPGLSAFDGAPPASTDSVPPPPPQQSIDDALDKANRALIASDGSQRLPFAFNTGVLTPIPWTPAERKAAEYAARNPSLSPVSKALLDRTAAVQAGMFKSAFDTGRRPSVPPLAPGFDETGAAGDVPTSPVSVGAVPIPTSGDSTLSLPMQDNDEVTVYPPRPAPVSAATGNSGIGSAGLQPPKPPAREPTPPVHNPSYIPQLHNSISSDSSSDSREAGSVLSNANYNRRAQRDPDQAAESQSASLQPVWSISGSASAPHPATWPQQSEAISPMRTPNTTEGYDSMWAALDARMGPPPTPMLSEHVLRAKKIQHEMAAVRRAERDRIEAQRKENSMRVAAHQRIINEKIRMQNLERSQPPQPTTFIPAEIPLNIPTGPFFPFPGDPTLMPPPQPTTLISSSTLLTIPSGPLFPFIPGDPTFPPLPPPSYQVYTANTPPPIAPPPASFTQPSSSGNATTGPSAPQAVGEGPTTRRWDITPVRTMALNASAASSSPPAFPGGSGHFTAGPSSSPDPGEGPATTNKKGRGIGRTKASGTDPAQSEPPASSTQIEHDIVNRRRAKPGSLDRWGNLVGAQVPLQQDSTPLPSQPTVHFPNSGSLHPSGRIIRAGRHTWRETSPVPNPGQPMYTPQRRGQRKKPEVEAAEAGSSSGQSAVASRLPKGQKPPRVRESKYWHTPMIVTGAGGAATVVSSTSDELALADEVALANLPTPEPQSLPFSQAIPGVASPRSRLAVLDGIAAQSKDAAMRLAVLAGHEATEVGSSSGQPAQAYQTAKARKSIPYSQADPGINWQAIFDDMAARERAQVERLAELERHKAIVDRIMSGTNAVPASSVVSAASGQVQPLAGQTGLRPDQAASGVLTRPQDVPQAGSNPELHSATSVGFTSNLASTTSGLIGSLAGHAGLGSGQAASDGLAGSQDMLPPAYNFAPSLSSARRREKAPVTATLNTINLSAPNVPSAGPSRLRNEVVTSPPHLGFVLQQPPPSRQSGGLDTASVTTSAAASAAVGS